MASKKAESRTDSHALVTIKPKMNVNSEKFLNKFFGSDDNKVLN